MKSLIVYLGSFYIFVGIIFLLVPLVYLGLSNLTKLLEFLNFDRNNENKKPKNWVRNDKNDNIKILNRLFVYFKYAEKTTGQLRKNIMN